MRENSAVDESLWRQQQYLEAVSTKNANIRRDAITKLHLNHVSSHQLLSVHVQLLTLADHDCKLHTAVSTVTASVSNISEAPPPPSHHHRNAINMREVQGVRRMLLKGANQGHWRMQATEIIDVPANVAW